MMLLIVFLPIGELLYQTVEEEGFWMHVKYSGPDDFSLGGRFDKYNLKN